MACVGLRGASLRSRVARRGERGAVMVEMAIALPLLMTLLLAIMTAGLAYNRSNSINNAAREAARYGAVLPISSDLEGWLTSVADVAKAGATGDLDDDADGQQICVAFVFPDGVTAHQATKSLTETAGVRAYASTPCIADDGRPDDEPRVQVVLERLTTLETIVFTRDITLDGQAVARYERVLD